MNEIIKPHYENEDIQRLNLFTDINKWKSEATFIALENEFYQKLFSSEVIDKTNINPKDIKSFLEELETLTQKNQIFLDSIREFLINLEGINECDDMQCETFYLNHHQKFKIEIENYFFQNRKLKTHIYSCLGNGLKKYL